MEKNQSDLQITLDKIRADVAEIKTSQRVMERDIAHHIKRTDLAEENMQAIREELKPVKRHVAMLEGAAKLVGLAGVAVAITSAIINLIIK